MLCQGVPVTFTAHPVNGGPTATFTWKVFVPGSTIFTGPVYIDSTLHHGDYVECTMHTGGICASPDTVSVPITMNIWENVAPTVTIETTANSDTIAYLGQIVYLYSNVTWVGNAPTYQWYKNGVAIPGATASSYSTHVYVQNDTFYVKVTSNSVCDINASASSNSNSIIIYSNSYTSVKSVANTGTSLTLFPNPNTGSFVLSGKTTSAMEVGIEVTDMLGRIIYSGKTMPHNGVIRAEIGLGSGLSDGTYLVRANSETGTEVFHFVVGK